MGRSRRSRRVLTPPMLDVPIVSNAWGGRAPSAERSRRVLHQTIQSTMAVELRAGAPAISSVLNESTKLSGSALMLSLKTDWCGGVAEVVDEQGKDAAGMWRMKRRRISRRVFPCEVPWAT